MEAVGPAVIGAAQGRLALDRRAQYRRAAVPADIVEGANLALAVAQENERHAGRVDRHGVAGVGDLVGESDADPVPAENELALESEERRNGIGRRRTRGGTSE